MQEVEAIMKCIDEILKDSTSKTKSSDIGVVSPYGLQCKKMILACKAKGLNDITIGTSEIFQGQERKVIIVSTVRSRQRYLGDFVSDPQVIVHIRNLTFIRFSFNLISLLEIQCDDNSCDKSSNCCW